MTRLMPRVAAPPLSIKMLGGPLWRLQDRTPDCFTMLVVYRGLHCGVCKTYLQTLNQLYPAFLIEGVEPIAVSSDSEHRAREAVENWALSDLPLGYALPPEAAGDWGLYLSAARKDGEPAWFFEPALFLIKPDSTVYFTSIQNMPFGRPDIEEILRWIPKIRTHDIPARGELPLKDAKDSVQYG